LECSPASSAASITKLQVYRSRPRYKATNPHRLTRFSNFTISSLYNGGLCIMGKTGLSRPSVELFSHCTSLIYGKPLTKSGRCRSLEFEVRTLCQPQPSPAATPAPAPSSSPTNI
jgi:hypothetical protein